VDRALEVAVVAHEGFIGPDLLRRPPTAISRFLVQSGGRLRRASHQSLRRLLERSPIARQLAARCREALFDQVILCAACNAGHSPRERCARWFLMIHDRSAGDEFLVKQEFLGYMLGMTRQTVSGVASELQERGSIEYSRGRIRVIDREGLERLACPCYSAIRARLHEQLS
jgi:CRP-like cAMP-binding protein